MSIFDNEENKRSGGAFWQKKTIGDRLEGTFVSKKSQLNQLSGKDQLIYRIKTVGANGAIEYMNVGGTIGIDSQMQGVKYGQIVGFEYVKDTPNKKKGFSPVKVVQVYANPKDVDHEWLKEQENGGGEGNSDLNEDEGPMTAEIAEKIMNGPTPAPASEFTPAAPTTQPGIGDAPFLTKSEETALLASINAMAKAKFGLEKPEEIKLKVMEATNLAFIAPNLQKIVEALDKLPNLQ